MVVPVRLALFVAGAVLAVVAGWALGRATAVLVPDLIVPGNEPVHPHSLSLPAPLFVLPGGDRMSSAG